jgi:hypothetical protein
MRLQDYDYFQFPLDPSCREMSDRQAEIYFESFVEGIPRRLAVLQRAIKASGDTVLLLDYSFDSLRPLGDWFGNHIETCLLTQDELIQKKKPYPSWLHDYIPPDTFTIETVSLIMDVGIYFAETLRHRHPILKWDLLRLPPNNISYNQPVVVPFRDGDHLYPFLIIFNVAGKQTKGENPADVLPKLFQVWENLVPQ